MDSTPTPPASIAISPGPVPRRRRVWLWLGLILAITAVLIGWRLPHWHAQAAAGAAYGARIGCSCVYVQGRTVGNCVDDFEPGMEIVALTNDPATNSVTASVPLLASRTARFAGATGCLLDPLD